MLKILNMFYSGIFMSPVSQYFILKQTDSGPVHIHIRPLHLLPPFHLQGHPHSLGKALRRNPRYTFFLHTKWGHDCAFCLTCPIIIIMNTYIMLLCTHLYHCFPVSIHYLQCIHCLLHYVTEYLIGIYQRKSSGNHVTFRSS